MIRQFLSIPLIVFATGRILCGAEISSVPSAIGTDDVFASDKVWNIHLRFTSDQWKAMEPTEGARAERGRNQSFLVGPEGGRNGIAAAFGIKFDYVHADLEFGSRHFNDVGVRYKGNGTFLTSRDGLKRSLKIDMNRFINGQKLAEMKQVNLHNSVRDPSGMNEVIAYDLFRAARVPAPRTAYAKVFVTVPDLHEQKYFGLYNLVEDIGSHFIEKHFGTKDGALLKPVTPELFGDLGGEWSSYNQTYDPKGALSDKQKDRIIETCKFVSGSSADDFEARLGEYFDLENVARYFAMTVWLSDLDGILGPGQNYYLHLHPETRKFSFIAWDQDQSFGQFPRGRQEQREQLNIHTPWNGRNPFLEKLFAAASFKSKYLEMLGELNQSVLQPGGIHPQVDGLATLLRDPIKEESEVRLEGFEKAAAGKIFEVVMGPGYREPVPTTPIKPFVEKRWKSVDDQLAGRAEGETIRGR